MYRTLEDLAQSSRRRFPDRLTPSAIVNRVGKISKLRRELCEEHITSALANLVECSHSSNLSILAGGDIQRCLREGTKSWARV